MHRHQGLGQAWISEAGQQTYRNAALDRVIEQPAQHLQQHDFEQSVGQQAVTAAHTVGLSKQQGQRLVQALDLVQWQQDHGGKGARKRVAFASLECQRCAGEVRPLGWGVMKVVRQRPWVEDKTRFAHHHAAGRPGLGAVLDDHLTAPQDMQKGTSRLGVKVSHAAKRAVVKQVGSYAETLQQRGQAIDGQDHGDVDDRV